MQNVVSVTGNSCEEFNCSGVSTNGKAINDITITIMMTDNSMESILDLI